MILIVPIINPMNKKILTHTNGELKDDWGNSFPIINDIPRFAEKNNYTDSFGFQWNRFSQTQVNGKAKILEFTKERFFAETGWESQDLTGQDVLEVGSGAGRFTQIALNYTNGNVYSIDYSDSVTENYQNNSPHGDRLKLFQASIYQMPFPADSFDKVFCFGMLQHTPDFKRSIECLIEKTKPGGEIVVDFYQIKGWYTKVNAKYMLRPFTRKISHSRLLRKIEKNADWLINVYYFFYRLGLNKYINRFLPICDIERSLPKNLSKAELKEWVILDTFDMFSPTYDNPQRIATVKKWMEESGAKVTFAGVVNYSKDNEIAVVKAIKRS